MLDKNESLLVSLLQQTCSIANATFQCPSLMKMLGKHPNYYYITPQKHACDTRANIMKNLGRCLGYFILKHNLFYYPLKRDHFSHTVSRN